MPPYAKSAVPSREQSAAAEDRREVIERLAAQVDKGRKSSTKEMIEWVLENVPVEPSSIDPDDIPCRGALTMLAWARKPGNVGAFITSVWARLIPPKLDNTAEARYHDDGRKVFDLLEKFRISLEDE